MLHHRLRSLWGMTFILFFICLTFHFVILFIFAMPLNPIQYTFMDQMHRYNDTFFTQNWRLFAPDPVSNNITVLARATFTSSDRSQALQYTPWEDLTDPLIHAVQQNRFTELQIPELMLSNAAISVVNDGVFDSSSPLYQAISHGQYPSEYLILVRYASHVLNQSYPQTHFISLQLSISETEPPDFLHYMSNGNKILGTSIFPPMKYPSVA
jgi:Family of unknown function (DUF5819)